MKKKRQLIGGILLMILGLGICGGSMALRFFERSGYGPFNVGHKIVSRHGMNGGFNQNPNFKVPNGKQAPKFKNQNPKSQNDNGSANNSATPNQSQNQAQ